MAKESLRVNFSKFAEVGGTLCIYMGMSKMEEIVDKLIAGGLPEDRPAAIVSHGTLPRQQKVLAPLKDLVSVPKKNNWVLLPLSLLEIQLDWPDPPPGLSKSPYMEGVSP